MITPGSDSNLNSIEAAYAGFVGAERLPETKAAERFRGSIPIDKASRSMLCSQALKRPIAFHRSQADGEIRRVGQVERRASALSPGHWSRRPDPG
jgi:hypothetical protein